MSTTLAYYPGCSLHGTSGEFDASFRASARALGLTLLEIPGWECCGNTAAHSINRLLATALPVNELAKVEQDMKLDAVAVPCAACFSRFKTGAHEVGEDAGDGRRRQGRRRPPVRRRRHGAEPRRRVPRRRRPRGARGQGHAAVQRPQGRLLLRLPAHAAAQGHAGRGPRVPHAHGRRRQGHRLRARRLELQDRLLRRLAGAHRAGHRRRPRGPHPRPTPRRAAPTRSPWPARSARPTSTGARPRSCASAATGRPSR